MLNNEILRNQLVSRRTFIIGAGKLGLITLLASRMFYIQMIKKDEYKTLSDKNRISMILLPPARGQIYDNSGKIIATNRQCFRLLLDKSANKNYQEEIELIAKSLDLTLQKKTYILNKLQKASKRTPVLILDQLDWQQISIIEEHKIKLSSIFIDMGYIRNYPIGMATGHVIGYTGQINEQEKQELKINNSTDFNIGKAGIEKYYEQTLRGEFGYKQMEINAYGKYVREITHEASKQGNDLYLNIDSELQNKIYPYLNRQGCSAIVMDCYNGNVILLANTPAFEPNNFTKLSQEYWSSLISSPYKPLINKAVQSSYPPGSVFKLITILAALEASISPDKIVNCTGESALGGNNFRCSSKHGHGLLDMRGAIKYSCNTYMYKLGRLIGPDKILEMAEKFSFGKATGIDLPSEASGFLPSKKWKKSKYKTDWSIGDTFNLSIGQGFLLATPIQMARFSAAIASNGKLLIPQLQRTDNINFEQINIAAEHLTFIQEAMFLSVNESGGSAYHSRISTSEHQFAGKTGTSQVQSKANADDDLSRESIAWEKRNHAIFIGFGPYAKPRYAVTVFVDHGGGGRVAAPIANRIMSEIFQKYL